MKKIIFIFVLLCFMRITHAQVDVNSYYPSKYSIIPPSPEVASLMKYVDFPVSYFTGQPEINIPIYTIQDGSLSIPISISYHGGGLILMDGGSGMIDWSDYYYDQSQYKDPKYPQVVVIDKTTKKIINRYYIDKRNCDNDPIKFISVPPGEYTIELLNPRNFVSVREITINGYFGIGPEAYCLELEYIPLTQKYINMTTGITKKQWCGLRIAKITSQGDYNTTTTSKQYEYNLNGRTYSFGI